MPTCLHSFLGELAKRLVRLFQILNTAITRKRENKFRVIDTLNYYYITIVIVIIILKFFFHNLIIFDCQLDNILLNHPSFVGRGTHKYV